MTDLFKTNQSCHRDLRLTFCVIPAFHLLVKKIVKHDHIYCKINTAAAVFLLFCFIAGKLNRKVKELRILYSLSHLVL